MDFYTFISDNPVMSFSTFVLVIMASIFVLPVTMTIIFKMYNRTLRSLNILIRGWPPEHLDADGDWKSEQK